MKTAMTFWPLFGGSFVRQRSLGRLARSYDISLPLPSSDDVRLTLSLSLGVPLSHMSEQLSVETFSKEPSGAEGSGAEPAT